MERFAAMFEPKPKQSFYCIYCLLVQSLDVFSLEVPARGVTGSACVAYVFIVLPRSEMLLGCNGFARFTGDEKA